MTVSKIASQYIQQVFSLNVIELSTDMTVSLFNKLEDCLGSKGKKVRKLFLNCTEKRRLELAVLFWQYSDSRELQWLLTDAKLPLCSVKELGELKECINSLVEFLGVEKLIKLLSKKGFKLELLYEAYELVCSLSSCDGLSSIKMSQLRDFPGMVRRLNKAYADVHNVKFNHKYQINLKLESGMELITPSDSNTLVEWGKDLNLCLQHGWKTYADTIEMGLLTVFGIKVNDKIAWVVCLDNFSVEEGVIQLHDFEGKDHCKPTTEFIEEITGILLQELV